MKPEELQIGDIVNVHRCECVADGGYFQEWDEYGKVVSITEDYITIKYIGREEDYGFEDVYGEDISPIPLTPEILVKNGFHKSMPYNDWINDNVNLILTDYAYGYNVQNTSIVLNCIHELQHALKLCGIYKEITI